MVLPIIPQRLHRRPKQCRHTQQKRELRRRRGSQSAEISARDRHHRAARARPHRQHLQRANPQRIQRRHVVDPLARALVRRAPHPPAPPRLNHDHVHAAYRKRQHHRPRIEQMLVDPFLDKEPDHRRGQKRHDDVQQQLEPRVVHAQQPAQHLHKPRPVQPDHRQNRPALDHDLERVDRALALRVRQSEQVRRDDEMPGGRDRQKLGDAFDESQNNGLPGVHGCLNRSFNKAVSSKARAIAHARVQRPNDCHSSPGAPPRPDHLANPITICSHAPSTCPIFSAGPVSRTNTLSTGILMIAPRNDVFACFPPVIEAYVPVAL